MNKAETVKSRRRGKDLEHAILEQAWAEVAEHGYSGLTMEAVASRAGTSRTVLARRWEGKFQLAIAAIRHEMAKHPLGVTECGALRTELLDYLQRACQRVPVVAAVFSLLSSEYFERTAASLQQLRGMLTDGEEKVLAAILARAAARGEIDGARLIPAVETLLPDLFRYHVMMSLSAPAPALREVWIDAILLPALRPG